jgi:LuxR family maltose regulon positive regulatory protein
MYLALSLQAAGETGAAMRMMEKGRQVSRNLSSSVDTNAAAYEAKLHAEAGDFAFIARWSELCGLSGVDELPFHRAREYIVYARALLIQGKVDESLALIKRLLPLAQDASAVLYEIELLILQAIALHTRGEEEQAMLPFERALLLAEPEGLIRIFIDEGGKIQVLLRQAAHGAHTKNYAARLLAVLEASLPARGREQSMPAANLAAGYNDTLTHREIEILRMLVSHRSITEIAAELCIATSTLRTHIRNIYDKLGVHSRIEAITIAREMNLS